MHSTAEIHYQFCVCDAAGKILREMPWRKNMITDSGMEFLGTDTGSYAGMFTHAAYGDGATPTKRASESVTVAQSGTTLTASDALWTEDDVGRIWKFDTGEEVRIAAYVSATEATGETSATVAAAPGSVHYVTRSALGNSRKTTNTYRTESGDNGTYTSGQTLTYRRTFLFGVQSGAVAVNEVAWMATSGGAAMGISNFAEAVPLLDTQRALLKVEVKVFYAASSVDPVETPAVGAASTGLGAWADADNSIAQNSVSSSGSTQPNSGNFNSTSPELGLMLNNFSLPALFGAFATNSGTTPRRVATRAAYTALSFFRDMAAVWPLDAGNGTVYGLFVGSIVGLYVIKLDTPFTKTSDQTLTVTWRHSWSRVLNN